ncbi:hypothetical protein DRE_05167 [Drechslerella stenobrocha 248]|uniref:G domain-containing protein n=1 Tax=Drechslerella stenobrocha 248 TaxID=1043628 RepID=W7HNI9_9PEZI|nr:hypothetical protein DRE_05167 [Drechslerella stenobrocha 248]
MARINKVDGDNAAKAHSVKLSSLAQDPSPTPPTPPTPATQQAPASTNPPLPDEPTNSVAQVDAIASQPEREPVSLDRHVDDPSESSADSSHTVCTDDADGEPAEGDFTEWGEEREVLIAVMGMTGAGKTTFISKATGKQDIGIGHDLKSSTREITIHSTKIDGITVHFIDTPGFCDSDVNISDAKVLELIAEYLNTAYNKDQKLNGIIYLHPISETRMKGPAVKNLSLFQKLVGDDNLKNVVFITSMWSECSDEVGAHREQQLHSDFWRFMLDCGAATERFQNTPESAHDLTRMLIKNAPVYVQLQKEMSKGDISLKETTAGMEIMEDIIKARAEHQKEMEETIEMIYSIQHGNNEKVIRTLRKHYDELVEKIEQTQRDERVMIERRHRKLEEDLRIVKTQRNAIATFLGGTIAYLLAIGLEAYLQRSNL